MTSALNSFLRGAAAAVPNPPTVFGKDDAKQAVDQMWGRPARDPAMLAKARASLAHLEGTEQLPELLQLLVADNVLPASALGDFEFLDAQEPLTDRVLSLAPDTAISLASAWPTILMAVELFHQAHQALLLWSSPGNRMSSQIQLGVVAWDDVAKFYSPTEASGYVNYASLKRGACP